jgi:hypothetical protein
MHSTSVHLMGGCLMGVYLTGVYLIGVCLMSVYLTGAYLTGCISHRRASLYLTGVHLTGVHLMGYCQYEGQAESRLNCLYVRDAMYSSYTSILLVVVTNCCLHSRYQQAEIGRGGTSRHPALDRYTSWACIS